MLNMVHPKIEVEASSLNYGRFVISPLESGYGITLGNALRRVLFRASRARRSPRFVLAASIMNSRPFPHVREDTQRLILNVKQIRLQSRTEEPVRVHVEISSEGPVTAGDIVCPPKWKLSTLTITC